MTTFQVFCENCNSDYSIDLPEEIKPGFCSVCGTELDESSYSEGEHEDWQDEDFDKLLDDVDGWEWKNDER
jgi:predicted amidophosphoribosyltransferase